MNFYKLLSTFLWVIFALLDPDPQTRLNTDPIRIRIHNPVWNSPDSLDRFKDVLVATSAERHRGSQIILAAASPWLRSLLSATTDNNSYAGEASRMIRRLFSFSLIVRGIVRKTFKIQGTTSWTFFFLRPVTVLRADQ